MKSKACTDGSTSDFYLYKREYFYCNILLVSFLLAFIFGNRFLLPKTIESNASQIRTPCWHKPMEGGFQAKSVAGDTEEKKRFFLVPVGCIAGDRVCGRILSGIFLNILLQQWKPRCLHSSALDKCRITCLPSKLSWSAQVCWLPRKKQQQRANCTRERPCATWTLLEN